MRIFLIIFLLALVDGRWSHGMADDGDDCVKGRGDYIAACTRVIASGAWKGQQLSRAYVTRGFGYERKGRINLAIADYGQALKLDPNNIVALYNRAVSYGRKRKFNLAIADLTLLIKLKPKFAVAYRNRGVALSDTHKYARAVVDFTHAIKINPKYAEAYTGRAWAHHRQGKAVLALADANKAVALKPRYASGLITRASILEFLKRRPEAIADYRAVLKVAPSSKVAWDGLKRLGAKP